MGMRQGRRNPVRDTLRAGGMRGSLHSRDGATRCPMQLARTAAVSYARTGLAKAGAGLFEVC